MTNSNEPPTSVFYFTVVLFLLWLGGAEYIEQAQHFRRCVTASPTIITIYPTGVIYHYPVCCASTPSRDEGDYLSRIFALHRFSTFAITAF